MTLKVKMQDGHKDERFKKYFIKNMLDKKDNTFELSFVPENAYTDLSYFIGLNVEIIGWVGCVVVDKTVLDQEVPVNFENSKKEDETQKLWKEYTLYKIKNDKCGILIGWRDSNGNRPNVVSSKEFYDYVNHFGISTVKHKDDYIAYFKEE